MKEKFTNPYKYYLLIALVLLVAMGIILWKYTAIHPALIYLIAITIITFCFYGYDKRRAVKEKGRIPEAVLHLLALIGGSIGALAGQIIFHHKTRKLKFQAVFILIVILQIALIAFWIMRNNN